MLLWGLLELEVRRRDENADQTIFFTGHQDKINNIAGKLVFNKWAKD